MQRNNAAGLASEKLIINFLESQGHVVKKQRVIGKNIYGGNLRCDIYLPSTQIHSQGLAVEIKWQDVPGTADEKFPYLAENIKHAYPCPVIVILHGGGFRAGAELWLRRQVDGIKFVAVYRLEEFLSWAMRNLKLNSPALTTAYLQQRLDL